MRRRRVRDMYTRVVCHGTGTCVLLEEDEGLILKMGKGESGIRDLYMKSKGLAVCHGALAGLGRSW